MTLTLRIENFDQLADGGPLSFTAENRAFEVGRDPAMDWTLPDQNRFISGRHFEVRYERGGWMLTDVSTNGTFVNGASQRVKSPYRLEPGDQLQVGQYVISVGIAEGAAAAPGPGSFGADAGAGSGADVWGPAPAAAAPAYGTGYDTGNFAGQAAMPQYGTSPAPPGQTSPPGPGPAPSTPQAESFKAAPVSRPPMSHPGAATGDAAAVLRAIAAGAGMPEDMFLRGDPVVTAQEIGRALRVAGDELAGLLKARAAAKQSVRSGSRTMIGAENNNPLKFIPTPAERLDAMFGAPKPGFQRGAEAIQSGFDDVKKHQYATHAAIQPALARLLEDIAPEAVEEKAGGSLLGSRKARAWEIFVERWDAMTHPYENGMLDLFLTYFAEAYDTALQGKGGERGK